MSKDADNTKPRKCCSCVNFEPYDDNHTKGYCHHREEYLEKARRTFVCRYHKLNTRQED